MAAEASTPEVNDGKTNAEGRTCPTVGTIAETIVAPTKYRPRTPEQNEKLAAFRALLNEEDYRLSFTTFMPLDDACLCRYLRANTWDVDAAVSGLRSTLQWRQDMNIEKIVAAALMEELCGKVSVAGRDKYGRPCLILRPALENTTDPEANVRHVVYQLERAVASMPDDQESWVLFVSFVGYSVRNAPSLKISQQIVTIFQSHYPERLGLAFLVDAPWLFSTGFSLLQPFIHPVTREKIRFVGGGLEEGSEKHTVFSEFFNFSDLQSEFGGEMPSEFDVDTYLARDPIHTHRQSTQERMAEDYERLWGIAGLVPHHRRPTEEAAAATSAAGEPAAEAAQ